MSRIRVLIVDDAVVVRKVVSDALAADPDIEVVGTAANGRIGLTKVAQLKPDILTMDVEMPEMDGLATLRELRKTHPRLPVIMFSTLTARGAETTLEALSLGASDYVTKPSNVGGVTEAQARIRSELIPKIKALCGRAGKPTASWVTKPPAARPSTYLPPPSSPSGITRPPAAGPSTYLPPAAAGSKPLAPPWGATPATGPKAMPWGARATTAVPAQPVAAGHRPDLLAVAASTGGPNALTEFFAALGPDFPIPVVLVQHMPPMFTRLLAERLTAKTGLRVAEGVDGGRLEPGCAWIAPGDFHMCLVMSAGRPAVRLNQQATENGCRPAADVLFRSVAEVIGANVLAVVLTGMGQDGLRGCEAIAKRGGRVFAQDEATSVVWGMPGFVARAGLAEKVLPLSALGPEVARRARAGRTATVAPGGQR